MKVTQLHELVNVTMQEVLGQEAVVNEDLTNVVDLGNEVINTDNLDHYVKKLVNHIGKVIFVNRVYNGSAPSVLMDSWEFGSILEKISADMPEAQENDTWNLVDGQSYDDDIFYQPKVSAKFFNSQVTFEIPMSFTERQVKESFSNATQLNGFISMLVTAVENAMTVKLDSLVMRTINNMIAETLLADLTTEEGTLDTTTGTVKAVNLLADYNTRYGGSLTKDEAVTDPEFIKYASYVIGLYTDRISKISTLFNVGGKARFTPANQLHLVLLSEFAKASTVFLESEVTNEANVKLPNYETVPYWQGSGEAYGFDETSKIDVTTDSGTLEMDGIVGVMFDRQAIGITNLDRRVTSNYNAKAEFYTNYYKFDAGYYNDLNENFVVFFVA